MVSLALPQSAILNRFRPIPTGRLVQVVNGALIVWLAWLLAGLSWALLPGDNRGVPQQQPAAVAPAPAVQRAPRIDERQIAGWHLFGEAGKDKPVKPSAVNAPETRLKLTLRGVFAESGDSSAGSARAIIGDPRGKENSYAPGDPLPGGAKLAEIYPDRIILERNGRFETLRLPKKIMKLGSGGAVPRGSVRNTSSGSAAAFSRYRSEIKRNPASMMNYVRATPERRGGKFIGFRLQPGRDPAAMKELGLKSGDVVTSINGVRIDSPAKGIKAMQALGEGDSVDITLLRGGQETSMSLTLPSSGR
ncbi:MAG TPA: type II secretion system protein GspC [Gammaproteobacteria bacterium]|nr:type II secretion system protein GspC [Gammaproteobacteria bacterium]